jgi:hypothetical protein
MPSTETLSFDEVERLGTPPTPTRAWTPSDAEQEAPITPDWPCHATSVHLPSQH